MSLLVVSTDARGVTASVTSALTHRCPFADEVDHGFVTVTWRVDGWTLELHGLRSWLDSFAGTVISHEDLTTRIRDEIEWLGFAGVTVVTHWSTAGMSVEVSA